MKRREQLVRFLFEQTESFEPDKWGRMEYLSLLRFSSQLTDLEEKMGNDYGRNLVSDAYFSLTGLVPEKRDVLGRAWARFSKEPNFRDLQELFAKDRPSQVIAVRNLAKAMADRFFRMTEETLSMDDADGSPFDEPSSVIERLAMAEGDEEPINEAQAEAAMALGSEVLGELANETEEEADLIRSLIGSLDADTPAAVFEKALGLTDLYDVRQFADILGWARRHTSGAFRENVAGKEELTGYSSSEWCDDIVPEDMMAVADGEPQALLAVAEGTLTKTEYVGRDPMGRGAVILLRDESISMLDWGSEKHKTALTMELALATVFNEQGRDLVSAAWGSRVEKFDRAYLTGKRAEVRRYTYGEPGLEKHVRSFMRSGTDLPPAMERGLEFADEYHDACDVLVLSDMELGNELPLINRQLEAITAPFKELGGRVWGVLFGDKRVKLDAWCDGYVAVDKLRLDDDTGQILRGIATLDLGKGKRVL